jgi:hypothetical protein
MPNPTFILYHEKKKKIRKSLKNKNFFLPTSKKHIFSFLVQIMVIFQQSSAKTLQEQFQPAIFHHPLKSQTIPQLCRRS